jgi:DNA-binding NarL/FixJ family response regulator
MNNSMNFFFTPSIRLDSSVEDGDIYHSEELQNNILNNIQDGVSIVDNDLCIRFINTYMENWYSSIDEIIGKKCYEVYHGREEPCESCPTLRSMKEKIPVRGVVSYTISGDKKGWQELLAVPILDQNDSVLGVFEYVRDITFQYRIQHELDDLMQRIESLENHNRAITELLHQRKEELKQFEESIIFNVEKFVKPSLEHIKKKTDANDVEMVEGLINEIVYPLTKKRPSILSELSARELQIATLIKEGKTSKEIAEILVISNKTVDYHRGNIRKKLGFRQEIGKRTDLRSFLINHL